MSLILRTGVLLLALALFTANDAASALRANGQFLQVPHGILREGIWKLDTKKSRQMTPENKTLWVIRDDGQHVTWVNALTAPDGKVSLDTLDGEYGGGPATVSGTGMSVRLAPAQRGRLVTSGEIAGMGSFREDCRITANNTLLTCDGRVATPNDEKTWLDVYNWQWSQR